MASSQLTEQSAEQGNEATVAVMVLVVIVVFSHLNTVSGATDENADAVIQPNDLFWGWHNE